MRGSYLAMVAAMLLTSQAAIAGDVFPKVVVTIAPLKPYVDDILQGRGEAQSLLRAGQDGHDLTLSPSQAKMLDAADIVIVPDLEMSPALKYLLGKKKGRVIELSALAGAEPLPYAAENPWLAAMKAKQTPEKKKAPAHKEHDAHGHEHDHHAEEKTPANDPHLWLDPERMAAIAEPLANAMADKAPEARSTFVANARSLATHLRREVMPQLQAMLKEEARTTDVVTKPILPFITYHAGYQYFLARFGLTHYGEITTRPEETLGAKTTSSLISGAKEVRIRCLMGEQENVLMQRIAEATSARIVLLSPEQLPARHEADALSWIHNDYDRFLYVTAKAFSKCL